MLIRISHHTIKRSLFRCCNTARNARVNVVASTPTRDVEFAPLTRADVVPLSLGYDAQGLKVVFSGMEGVRTDCKVLARMEAIATK